MGRNRASSRSIIMLLCKKLNVIYEEMYKMTKPLLQQFAIGKQAVIDHGLNELATIDGEKKGVRRRYIRMVRRRSEYTDLDIKLFAYVVACSSWFEALSDKLLEEMKRRVPDGEEMVVILTKVYLGEDAISDDDMMEELHMSNGTYHRMKKAAIVLYGDLILEYAIRREKEDIAKGIVEPPDFELD